MGSISSIISDLKFSRSLMLEAIAGLSQRELTEVPIYEMWTVKDILAHIIGWDQRVVDILPLIIQDRAAEVSGVEVETHNRRSIDAWRDKPLAAVLAAFHTTHQQILDIIATMDHVQIDLRHQRRNGRVITIRSYVLDIMMEHERQHALEIQQWRKTLEQRIDPAAITEALAQYRAEFMTLLAGLNEAVLLDKTAIGRWSVKDMVGHMADWEARMLKAAEHIFDPSLPEASPVTGLDNIEDWNEVMAARHENDPWAEVYQFLIETQAATDQFIDKLKPSDWKLRGPYPWPDDRGTLAELMTHMAEHYADHIPDLKLI